MAVIFTSASIAAADEWVDRANEAAGLVKGNISVEAELFPAVAAMDELPISERGPVLILGSMYMSPDSPDWSALAAWAGEAPQTAVLEALNRIGDPEQRWMVSVPFGRDAVDASWAEKDLCITLGGDGMLAGAQYNYLDALSTVHLLVTVEANRLLAAGEGDKGLERYAELLWLYRSIADRQTIAEKRWAMTLMIQTCGQMRDLAYRALHSEGMTGPGIAKVVASFEERELYIMRVRPPEMTRLIVEQLIERTLGGDGGAGAFAVAMARATTSDRPIMLFNESAKWRDAAGEHASAQETMNQADMVVGDYKTRWGFPFWDPLLGLPTDFQKMDHRRFAAVVALTGETAGLLPLRRQLVAELAGTRCALAGAGYQIARERPASELVNLQPTFIPSLNRNDDAYSYNEGEKEFNELVYFVPGTGGRVEISGRPGVHEIALPGEGSGTALTGMNEMQEQFPFLKEFGDSPDKWALVEFEEIASVLQEMLDAGADPELRSGLASAGVLDDAGQVSSEQIEQLLTTAIAGVVTNAFGTTIDITGNDFVLYSVGEDESDGGALLYEEDLIFWPPLISMQRAQGTQ